MNVESIETAEKVGERIMDILIWPLALLAIFWLGTAFWLEIFIKTPIWAEVCGISLFPLNAAGYVFIALALALSVAVLVYLSCLVLKWMKSE